MPSKTIISTIEDSSWPINIVVMAMQSMPEEPDHPKRTGIGVSEPGSDCGYVTVNPFGVNVKQHLFIHPYLPEGEKAGCCERPIEKTNQRPQGTTVPKQKAISEG